MQPPLVTVEIGERGELHLLHHALHPHLITEDNVDLVFVVLVGNDAYAELERRMDEYSEAEYGPRMPGVRLGGQGPRPGILAAMSSSQINQWRAMT